MPQRICLSLTVSICLCIIATPLRAGQFDHLFPVKKHDFGTVAVAAKTEFRFPIVNETNRDIHIRTVRASCGCTTPIVETEYVPAGKTGSILARYNTDTFRGKKGATLTVVIDKPFYSEVQLRVDGYIRRDMVFHPGQLEFGKIAVGTSATKECQVSYAGRSDWQIVDVRSNHPWIHTEFSETGRRGGTVTYKLAVKVREDAPAGAFQDEVVVVTDDRSMPQVPLSISGEVESQIQVSPQLISLGSVKPGEKVRQRLVIRGREPFKIEAIECSGWTVDFEPSSEAKKMHIVTTTFTPTDASGTQKQKVVIRTSDGTEKVTGNALLTAVVDER